MRKSNIIVLVILVIASIEALWLWNFLGFSATDPLDLTVAIVWWVIILGVAIAIIVTENRRRKTMRTIFVADGVLYNCETGVVEMPEDHSAPSYLRNMRNILSSLEYGPEANLKHDQPRLRFNYIVRSDKFSKDGKVWAGEVISINNSNDTRYFSNEQELSRIIMSAQQKRAA